MKEKSAELEKRKNVSRKYQPLNSLTLDTVISNRVDILEWKSVGVFEKNRWYFGKTWEDIQNKSMIFREEFGGYSGKIDEKWENILSSKLTERLHFRDISLLFRDIALWFVFIIVFLSSFLLICNRKMMKAINGKAFLPGKYQSCNARKMTGESGLEPNALC